MIELIRNSSHASGIATYSYDAGREYVKASTVLSGIAALEAEVRGWEWYQPRSFPAGSPVVCRVHKRNQSFMRISIRGLPGRKGLLGDGLSKNWQLIQRALEHYCSVWPTAETVPMHGDLSLDNVIDTETGVVFVDWEHFAADGAWWGFDAMHLLLETVALRLPAKGSIPLREAELVAEGIAMLHRHLPMRTEFLEHPAALTCEFMRENASHWGAALHNGASKFPVATLGPSEITKLDHTIHCALNEVL